MWYLYFFAGCLVLSALFNGGEALEKRRGENNRVARKIGRAMFWTGFTIGTFAVLAGIGWLWYWLCGGMIVVSTSHGFWEFFFGALATLWPFVTLLGVIAIFFGWRPPKGL